MLFAHSEPTSVSDGRWGEGVGGGPSNSHSVSPRFFSNIRFPPNSSIADGGFYFPPCHLLCGVNLEEPQNR